MGIDLYTSLIVGFEEYPDDRENFFDVIYEDPHIGLYQLTTFGESEYWGLSIAEPSKWGPMERLHITESIFVLAQVLGEEMMEFLAENNIKPDGEPKLMLISYYW